MPVRDREGLGRGFELGLLVCGLAWAAAALAIAGRAAQGIAVRFQAPALETLLASLFFLFLLALGFQLLDWVTTGTGEIRQALPVIFRLGWRGEWGLGAAIGWGLALAVVLPALVTLNLHAAISPGLRHPGALGLEVVTLLAVTLAQEAVFRGYLLTRVTAAAGPTSSVLLSSLAFAVVLVWGASPASAVLALLNGFLLGLLLALAVVRTSSLVAAWGLHFAYRVIILVLLGLPAAGHLSTFSVVDTFATGPGWLSGGAYGLDGALLTAPLLLVAIAVLYRGTRDYAWYHNFRPVAGAGYPVVVPPPAQHLEMERESQAAPKLVQIAASTSHHQAMPIRPEEQ